MPADDTVRSGFIIMPFLDDLKWLHRTIVQAGARAGVALRRADDIFEPGIILDQIREAIDAADVIVAVCTGRNANVFFEMGLAWRDHKPVLVADSIDDLPFDVAHYRTAIYGSVEEGQDRASLAERLERLIAGALTDERLPRGRRIRPVQKAVVRLQARYDDHGNSSRLVLTNAGTVEVRDVDVQVPKEAQLHLLTNELPLEVLRPGTSVPLPATGLGMGPGKRVFDIMLTAQTAEGERYEQPVTISMY